MTAHGQDGSKVDAIARFGKKQLKALDEKTFSNILAEVSTIKCRLHYTNPLVCSYTGIGMYGPSIARAKS
jgi:hypothetical protein